MDDSPSTSRAGRAIARPTIDEPHSVGAASGTGRPEASPAGAVPLDDDRPPSYASNPVPWWVAFVSLWCVAFGLVVLLKALIR
jgi:hypothetical protein